MNVYLAWIVIDVDGTEQSFLEDVFATEESAQKCLDEIQTWEFWERQGVDTFVAEVDVKE